MTSLLTSKTLWTVVLLFLIGGFQAISSSLGGFATPILGLLGILTVYFHVGSVNAAAGTLGSIGARNIQY